MKINFIHQTNSITVLLSIAWILGIPTSTFANQVSPASYVQASILSHDLFPSPSEESFRRWQQGTSREIQRLYQRQNASTESPLQTNVNPQAELERLPQLQPSNLNQLHRSR